MANKILLLGANGYFGKFIKSRLDTIPITRSECDLSNFDKVARLLKKHSPDIIINCAISNNTDIARFDYDSYLNNMMIFNNLYQNSSLFGKLISFGSGAEFDRRFDICDCKESDIFNRMPADHYGRSKNLISRRSLNAKNFYTIRAFGVFHETDNRLLSKIWNSDSITIENRLFDYFYLEDLVPVLEYFMDSPQIRDMNLVYYKKYYLREIVEKFKEIHNLNTKIRYTNSNNNYTGSSKIIDSIGFNFIGLEKGLEEYKLR